MYGYLRLISSATPASVQSYYRGVYCTLCHSLWNYYGLTPRFLLSFDMTMLSIVVDLPAQVNLVDHFLCIKRYSFALNKQEEWKRMAAMTVLLAAKKLEDDVQDDNKSKAKLGLRVFKKAANKAESDYPELAHIFRVGFADMSRMEKENADVDSLAERFARIITDATLLMYPESKNDRLLIRHVTKWVYFIDAIDDLSDDAQDNNYNPFLRYAKTIKELCLYHPEELESFIAGQSSVLKSQIQVYIKDEDRNRVIMSILRDTIPTVTHRILQGKKPYDRYPNLLKLIEERGGYRLA